MIQVLYLIRNYQIEALWVKTKYVPTYEEYMVNGRATAAVQVCVTGSLLGMDEVAEHKQYAQLMKPSMALEACEYIVRLMDDIVTAEVIYNYIRYFLRFLIHVYFHDIKTLLCIIFITFSVFEC